MALEEAALPDLGPIETREAWPKIAASYDPVGPVIDHWFALTARADGLERQRRLDALEACIGVCRRTFEHRAAGRTTRDLEHTLAVEASLRELRGRPDAIEAEAIEAFADRARTLLRAMPGRMALMRPESPRPLEALPEAGQPGALRSRLADEAKGQAHPIMRRLQHQGLLQAWVDLALASTGRWVDLGSADGRSLIALAERSQASETIGVDVAWSFSIQSANRLATGVASLPEGVRYVLLGQGGGLDGLELERAAVSAEEQRFPDRLAARTVATLGAHCASVVSLLYPIHMPQLGTDGVSRPAVEFQLATAVKLLAAGGAGLLVTEDVRAWKHAVASLMRNPAVESVLYCADAIGREQLLAMGVLPYEPTMGELDPGLSDRKTIEAPAAPFAWGLPLVFTTRV